MAFLRRGLWGVPLWLYLHLPGFAAITEWKYRFVAAHRDAGYRITRALWGTRVEYPTYNVASWLFARAIALIYLIAFISFGRQVRGLIGAQGIQPVTEFLTEVTRQFGTQAFWRVPTIFWWIHSEYGLLSIAWGGAVVAGVAAIGRPHTPGQKGAFILLFIYYLSIVNGGQIFMGYQWDFLLLECGFLAIFLKPSWVRVWLFRWLLFRLMFESGAVKLLSHDPTWRNLTALAYITGRSLCPRRSPGTSPQLPLWFQKLSTVFVFAVELGLPFLMFGPRRLKQIAAAGTVLLQTLILLTGNYTFFNYLTIALCLFLLDDTLLSSAENQCEDAQAAAREPLCFAGPDRRSCCLFRSTNSSACSDFPRQKSRTAIVGRASAFGIVNEYGLFATMTTSRPEISIEGSNDGTSIGSHISSATSRVRSTARPVGCARATPPRLADVVCRAGKLSREPLAAAFHGAACCKVRVR